MAFRRGTFVVKRLTEATKVAEMVIRFKPYYEGYKRRSFVIACRTLFKTNGFDQDQMLRKVSKLSSKLVDCTEMGDYLELLVGIYNYHTEAGSRLVTVRDGSKLEVKKA